MKKLCTRVGTPPARLSAAIRSRLAAGITGVNCFLTVFILAAALPAVAKADVVKMTTIGGVEVQIRRGGKGQYPVVIFSHGAGSCPGRASQILSRIANRGYMVISPIHSDAPVTDANADCQLDLKIDPPEGCEWGKYDDWDPSCHSYRKDEIIAILKALPESHQRKYIDFDFATRDASEFRPACLGYSLGGYTCMGLAGGWDTWKQEADGVFETIALLSPVHGPFTENGYLHSLTNAHTLVQGGDEDVPNSHSGRLDRTTPMIGEGNAFDQMTATGAKYLQEFKNCKPWRKLPSQQVCDHGAWADTEFGGAEAAEVKDVMAWYLFKYFDVYMKGEGAPRQLEDVNPDYQKRRAYTVQVLAEHGVN